MYNLKCKKKIIGVVFVILLYFVGIGFINAETIKVVDCEYTTQYKKWLKLSDKEKENVTMPVKCKTSNNFFTSIGSNVSETYQSQKFDLRDYGYVTSLKDQGGANLCWAFGTYASMESNLLMNNLGSYDFSEAHMGFSIQNKNFDSLMPANRTYDGFGNYILSSAYLFNRFGPVLESDMPYSYVENALTGGTLPTIEELSSKNTTLSVNSTAMLNANQGACTSESIASIKKYLVSNGAIGAQMFFDLGNIYSVTDDYNIISNTINKEYYYYDGSAYTSTLSGVDMVKNSGANHAVTIVGWDDTIDASNFSTNPSRNGAFIIKNSYGTKLIFDDTNNIYISMGDDGYYYVSYDDINICSNLVGFYDIRNEKEDNAYYHDSIGVNYALQLSKNLYVANVFEKKSNTSEKLEKISFLSFEPNQQYDILVSIDGILSNATVVKSGVTDRSGYITEDIDGIELTNPKYGIAIKFYYNENNTNGIYVYYDSNEGIYTMDVNSGKSFISLDGETWDDFVVSGTNFLSSIRAYTNNLNYTLVEKTNEVINDKFVVTYDYSNISNIENISYNIYKESDVDYSNSLSNDFDLTNNLASQKSIEVGLKDQSSEGEYILLVQYNDIKITTKFSVSLDENNKLFFGKNKIEEDISGDGNDNNNNLPDDENNSGDIEIEIEDNPLNNDVNNSGSNSEDVTSNPKTGSKNMVLIVLVITTLGIAILTNNYIKNRKTI